MKEGRSKRPNFDQVAHGDEKLQKVMKVVLDCVEDGYHVILVRDVRVRSTPKKIFGVLEVAETGGVSEGRTQPKVPDIDGCPLGNKQLQGLQTTVVAAGVTTCRPLVTVQSKATS